MTGEELRQFRRRFKLTQQFVAKFVGVSRQTVNAWEGGRHPVPVDLPARLPTKDLQAPRHETHVTVGTQSMRHDLRLYKRFDNIRDSWHLDIEHPHWILPDRHLPSPCPIEILEDPEYLRRVALQRAGKWRVSRYGPDNTKPPAENTA